MTIEDHMKRIALAEGRSIEEINAIQAKPFTIELEPIDMGAVAAELVDKTNRMPIRVR